MRTSTILAVLTCSLFLTAHVAMGKGTGAQTGSKATTQTRAQDQTKTQDQTRTREQLLTQTKLDLQLRDRVQEQLRLRIKDYDQNKYTVMSENGEVTLQGIVRTREEAEQMEKEALRVRGVSRVRNNLAVELE